jgi:hypothetical protein
MTRNLAMGPK